MIVNNYESFDELLAESFDESFDILNGDKDNERIFI